jgi:hypothetical protein
MEQNYLKETVSNIFCRCLYSSQYYKYVVIYDVSITSLRFLSFGFILNVSEVLIIEETFVHSNTQCMYQVGRLAHKIFSGDSNAESLCKMKTCEFKKTVNQQTVIRLKPGICLEGTEALVINENYNL